MENLEQTVETSFLNKVRTGLNRVKQSTFNKIAVYSLAGVLGAGLGYGCEGDTSSNGSNSSTRYACVNNQCVEDSNGPYAVSNCDGVCVAIVEGNERYSCVNNQCVEDPNGLYAIPNCDNTCVKETELFCWDKIVGKSDNGGELYSIQQTSDGGYIAAGFISKDGGYDIDARILKLDVKGNLIWDKTFGESEIKEGLFSIQQTNDLGYIVAGHTESKGVGERNAWIIKLDSTGEIEWDNTFGEQSKGGSANSIQQTTNGEYIIAGKIGSKSEYYSDADAWVFKLDANGNLIWDTTFGGSDYDEATSIQQTTDGGYIVANNIQLEKWSYQSAQILKLNSNGKSEWEKIIEGVEVGVRLFSIQPTNDEGYIAAGHTTSKSTGGEDTWVLKLDSKGEMKWDKTFEGNYNDRAESIQQTTDGGYVVAGYTNETLIVRGQKVGGQPLGVALILKLDSFGNLECE